MKRCTACFALFAAAAMSASAFDLDWWALRMGGGLLLNMDTAGAPSPVSTFVGFQLDFGFAEDSPASWAPTFDLTMIPYEWTGSRAVPTEIEHRQAWFVTIVVDSPIMLRVPMAEGFDLSLGGGLLAVLGYGIKADPYASQADVDAINLWNLNPLRMFAPEVQARFDIALAPGSTMGVGLRFGMPLLGMLDPGCPSILDRSWIDLSLSLRFD